MVKNEVVEFILDLADRNDQATFLDFEMLSKLLGQYPDFDLLRKVFVDVGFFLGSSRESNFENEKRIWEKRKQMLLEEEQSPKKEDKIAESSTNGSIRERYEHFIKQFKPLHSPKKIE